MKIAYFSPLNPLKSGISDFSEELLPHLKNYMDIDIFLAGYKTTNAKIREEFRTLDIKEYDYESIRKQYDIAIFHVGNNYECHKDIVETFLNYGGILELHDIALHHYLAEDTVAHNNTGKYIEIMKYCHGLKGENVAKKFCSGSIAAPWENKSLEFTVCKHLIDKAEGIIVHSDYAKQMIKGMRLDAKVINIPLHTPDIIDKHEEWKVECKQKLKIESNKVIMGAFGHATENKRIMQIIDSLALIKKSNIDNFHFYIVGKVSGLDIERKLKDLKLTSYVTVTGFTTLEEFKVYMGACDICFNLRYPTQGESSASLHRMLGLGKSVIVTKIGTFEEYPDDIVKKVRYGENEIQDIYTSIRSIIDKNNAFEEYGSNIVSYAKENYDVAKNAQKYAYFVESLLNGNYEEEYIDYLVDKLFETNLIDNNYLKYFAGNLQELF